MSSDATQRLTAALDGRYRIERRLGEGGMATVYLATDLKHERQVALKVLKPELAAVVGAERFLAEIKTTANLQHPHILPLYDSGSSDGLVWYVMPYLEGESLRDRLDREKQLGVKDAVAIAAKVADALDYAHERGIVHRDVKPGNILLSDRGEPLVADFGIALAVTTAGQGRVTETGLSMGTPHYMSPEQATGDRDVDPRSDIWALGCVLYELLAGDPPFAASSAQAVLARILTEDAPDVAVARPTTPPHVAAVIDTALQRLPADRFESAKAFGEALYDPGFVGVDGRLRMVVGPGPQKYRAPFYAAAIVAVFATMAAIGLAMRPGEAGDGEGPVTHFMLQPQTEMGASMTAALSPDGRRLAYAADGRTVVHDFGTGVGREFDLPPNTAFWFDSSSDGLLYREGTRLMRLSLSAGTSGPVIEELPNGPLTVDREGRVWVSDTDGRTIRRVESSGASEVVFQVPEGDDRQMSVFETLRDGEVLLALRLRLQAALPEIELQLIELESGRTVTLASGLTGFPIVVGDDVVVFPRDGALIAQRLDLRSLEPVGRAVPVGQLPGDFSAIAFRGGTAATISMYSAPGQDVMAFGMGLLDPDGDVTRLPNLPGNRMDFPDVSPDGRLAVFTVFDDDRSTTVWSYDLSTGASTRVSGTASARAPRFSADGESIFFIAEGDLWSRPTDGARPAERVLDLEGTISRIAPHPDGRRLVLQYGGSGDADTDWDIVMLDPRSPDERTVLVGTPEVLEGQPDVSPDGRWLAYYSNESGRNEVFVSSLDGPPVRQQVSASGGGTPRWGSTPGRLFFAQFTEVQPFLRSATLDLSGERPRVTAIDSIQSVFSMDFDVLPGDSLFLVPATPAMTMQADDRGIGIILNFDRHVREALASAR